MKKKKFNKFWIIISLAVIFLSVGSLFIFSDTVKDTVKEILGLSTYGISIYELFDADGNLIKTTSQSTIDGISGVKYITLKVSATNRDEVPLDLEIVDSTPEAFTIALDLQDVITTDPDESAEWISDLIDITQYEGTTQKFTATVEATSPSRTPTSKTYDISISPLQDPESLFEVTITSTSESDDSDIGCNSDSDCSDDETCELNQCVLDEISCSYTYSSWSNCVNSLQTRTVLSKIPTGCVQIPAPILSQTCSVLTPCSYTYSSWGECVNSLQTRTVLSKIPTGCVESPAPVLSQSCVVVASTNVIFRTTDTNYDKDTIIGFDPTPSTCGAETSLTEYKYGGYASASACSGTGAEYTVGTASGGYPLVKRTGYELSNRFYIYKGGNCYFFTPVVSTGGVDLSIESINPSFEIIC